ncbi:OLC1v1036998C1 [Oldenlandia corymbosa var. corymbosa]|uniref:OLC1v1036998C1 n=1 Tax=Oldenlandia corymbosa var. corymbosa TaxID=529605 RepID=A0AAV1CXT8_OLDCO|nr:OLC1v1036998C1 [Oldenlandia corymbosa var. corymbosa]
MAVSWSNVITLLCFPFSLFILSSASSEAEILLSFKDSLEDVLNVLSEWSNTTTIPHCNWTGITCAAENVYSVDLQSLNLSGEISSSICQLSKLTSLNLADNLFNQAIPLHLTECESLEYLNISNNLIWGNIPDDISGFKSLKVLDISRNHVEGKIPDGIGSLKNLQVLNLANNFLSGSVPEVLGGCSELLVLDISQNPFLLSEIPGDIGKLDKLEQLLLQSSGLYEEIPDVFEGLGSLSILDLSQNNLTGRLPPFGKFMQNLVSFDVSQNRLSGPIPDGMCEPKGLTNMVLHTNSFNGTISNDIIKECDNLERFQVQNNMFTGEFPSRLWSLPKIMLIRAENNNFSGEIPDAISKAVQLEQVQIDNNSFVSKVPQGFGSIRSLYRFSASQNRIYGELPPNFCDSPVMSIINFSHNHLSGSIPEIRNCKKLVSLALADNNFVGEIPSSLADLPVLTYLDLSENNLTGSIPENLQNLKLALFNVSFNRLSGRVPVSLISGLPASFLQGNPDLCGPGLPNACSRKHKMSSLSKFVVAIIIIVVVVVAAAAFRAHFIGQSNHQKSLTGTWKLFFFYPLRIAEHELLMAMDEKAAKRINGAFGEVYIIRLPSGESVAIKKMENFGSLSLKSLKEEVKNLAKIRHRNIVRILGFCHSNDSILLIYEHLDRGSLGDLIGKSDFDLPWRVRMKIAIGVAQGLAYLHEDYLQVLLHRKIKSTNILLDADYEPKLTDFALDRIVGENAFRLSLVSESETSPYFPPEYGYAKKATLEMETYSYGVILLELVTGRQAVQPSSSVEDSHNVVKWVRRKINIKDGAQQVLDRKIPHEYHQEMLSVLDIAVKCTNVMPEKRPSMSEIVRALNSINSSRTNVSFKAVSMPLGESSASL